MDSKRDLRLLESKTLRMVFSLPRLSERLIMMVVSGTGLERYDADVSWAGEYRLVSRR